MLTIKIETGNAAFEDDYAAEAAGILRRLADTCERNAVDRSYPRCGIRDTNGNTVGEIRFG